MDKNKYDVIIIGGGPAGLTSAIYTSRAFLKTLVLAGNPPGGQLTTTTEVENFPGFKEGIEGPSLIIAMTEQAIKFKTDVVNENVKSLAGDSDSEFMVTTDDGRDYTAASIIIATGASAKWLGLESEQRLRGKGVSACATCDGYFFKDKIIAVVGGGDASMEEAIFLTKYAEKVYILIRKDAGHMRASKIMVKRAKDNQKIQFIYNVEVTEVLGENMVSGIKIKDLRNAKIKELNDVKGLFVAIGHKPSTGFLKGFVDLDAFGYIIVHDTTKTSRDGVFVAGDAADRRYRQAITAAGTGCMAAIDAEKYLSEK